MPVQSVVWIQGSDNYARLHFQNGQQFLATRTLKWFEHQLPQFIRLRKSVLVTPAHVTRCQREHSRAILVTVRTGMAFPVARRRVVSVTESVDVC